MKRLLLMAFGLATAVSYSQVTDKEETLVTVSKDSLDGWKKGGYFALNGSQVSLTNWVAGGQNSISINALCGVYANLKRGTKTWENSLDFGYGLMQQSNQLFDANGSKWIKTDDRLDFTSKFGQKASDKWYYAALTNFRTQTTAGYSYPNDSIEISGFMAPGYWLTALGMDFKPNDKFSLFIAPITYKATFVNDQTLADAGSFGVTPATLDANGLFIPGTGKRFRSEFGGYLRVKYQTKLAENISFTTKLDLFSNYLDGHPERIDINWETLFEIKLWKFLSATVATHLIYDDDINISIKDSEGVETAFGPRIQFKEIFALGLSWKFDQ